MLEVKRRADQSLSVRGESSDHGEGGWMRRSGPCCTVQGGHEAITYSRDINFYITTTETRGAPQWFM